MNSELVKEFLVESFENLSSISDEITTYEKDPSNKELVNSIFRKVHTLKGSAGFLGYQKLQELTHASESLLDLIREGNIKINSELIDLFLISFDKCIEILKSIETTGKEPAIDYSKIAARFIECIKNPHGSKTTVLDNPKELELTRTNRISPKIYEEKIIDLSISKKIPEIVEEKIIIKEKIIAEVKMETSTSKEEKTSATSESESGDGIQGKSTVADSVVRVNVQLLDKIMNVVGELVLNRNQILQFANTMDSSELNRLSQQLNIITSELQGDIMTTRMQPVGSVLSKFERIVRDLARSQGKKIKLDIVGKDTELDKTLLEAIRDPLTHLIRNSVDHGIESPEIRKSRGKNEEGKIIIRSFHEGGQVSIEIKDDGNGIDCQKVLNKAIQKGIVTAEAGKTMSNRQIQNIIFMPGFSTADQVTNISGRGVGMDVVKSNIEKIGGTVDINSNFGEGSTFKLKIPLTLAIVPALVIQDKGETFAIPQISLVELVRLDSNNEKNKIEKLYDSEFFRLRGDLIPVFRLSETLKLKSESNNKSEGMTKDESDENNVNVVVLNAEGRTYGLIVDAILDTEEIVVKPLSSELKALTFFAGSTIMGDGRVALILDALGFYNFADKGHGQKIEKMNEDLSANVEKTNGDTQELLLIELGDFRSYAIPLILVNRLEEFKASQIEWTGEQAVIKYGDIPMPLINIESSLGLKGSSIIEKAHTDPNTLIPCVVVKIRNHMFGFVVNEIRDIAITDSTIHSDSVDRKGLLGTTFINDKTITMLDIHSILEDLKIGKGLFVKIHTKNKGRVLVVEDSPLYRKIQADFLEEQGYEVVVASNGQQALDILMSDANFSIIISDIEMPVMDGWGLAESIRKSGKSFSKIPVLAVSGKVSPKDKEKSAVSGFNEHLEKLNKDELLKSIQNYI
jgi:two-component system chemotaxis sensor kinase CheA